MNVCVTSDWLSVHLQAKHMLMLKDTVVQDIFQFLDSCECELNTPTHCVCVGLGGHC